MIYSEFSVLLWSKALVLDLDQAEQKEGKFHLQHSPFLEKFSVSPTLNIEGFPANQIIDYSGIQEA